MNQIGPHYVNKHFVWSTHLVYITLPNQLASKSAKFSSFFLSLEFLTFLEKYGSSMTLTLLLQLKRQSLILLLTRSYQLSEDLTLESRWMTNFSIFSNPCWKIKWPPAKVTHSTLFDYQLFNKFC